MAKWTMRIFAWGALVVSVGGVAAMLIAPPPGFRKDRDGVAYFTPSVENPETGDAVSIQTLIRTYRGD